MNESNDDFSESLNTNSELVIKDNPSVIRILYHAATGKTESQIQPITKKVKITYEDIERLVESINQ